MKILNKWIEKFFQFLIGINNLIYYFKVIWNDRDDDYYYILKLLRVKLAKTHAVWGTSSNYENDYQDKEKLQELINELDLFLIQSFDNTEAINKKQCSILLGKIGKHIPKLWT